MSLFEKVLSKDKGLDMDEFLNSLDEEPEESYENADAFVKPMDLVIDNDVESILVEAKQGNIVLVSISDLSKRNPQKLRDLISKIKQEVDSFDGDIARISKERVLVTPARVKIIKRRGQ